MIKPITDQDKTIIFQDMPERQRLRRMIWIPVSFGLFLVCYIAVEFWVFLNASLEWWFWASAAIPIFALVYAGLLTGSWVQLKASKRGILIKYGTIGTFRLFIDAGDIRNVFALPGPAGKYVAGMWRTGWIFHGANFNIIVGNQRAEAIALICRNHKYIISCSIASEAVTAIRQLYSIPADTPFSIDDIFGNLPKWDMIS